MSGVLDVNNTDSYDNSLVGLMGGTDNTRIGNVGDRAKVDAQISSIIGGFTTPKNISYEDGQYTRDAQPPLATWTTIYTYSGSGLFYGFNLNLEGAGAGEADKWFVNVVTDGTYNMFGANGINCKDIIDNNIYDILDIQPSDFCGLAFHDNVMRVDLKDSPIRFTTSITLQVRRITTLKKYKAALIKIAKD